ncbi:MAG: efflux transporter outer membrane subunit [Alphaproteobacteria bacterium]|nr:efflux transporter outer membrane subunit [Alphaproteobacteria bacterium]
MPLLSRLGLWCGVAATLAGCTLGPDFSRPQAPGDAAFQDHGVPELAVAGSPEPEQYVALGKRISGDWWHLLQSRALDQVLQEAIDGNRTLVAAQASVEQAREVVKEAEGGLYPQVNFNAGISRQKVNFSSSGLTTFAPVVFNLYQLGPSVDYAVDLWGGVKRTVEQEQALAEFQGYQLDAAYLTLTGNTVAQVIQIAASRAQIRAVESIIADDENNLRLVRIERQVGTVADPDVQLAASQLANDRALLPPLRQQLSVARHALAVLVGKPPVEFDVPDFELDQLTLPLELPVSLPSELVHQRPDILAAEADLHAATAAIGVATAAQYPSVTLSASISQAALNPHTLFTDGANAWSLGGALAAPIFHGGELEAQRKAAEAAYRGTLANYQQTILQSFGQVQDLLQSLAHGAELLDDERQAVEAAQENLRLTRIAFQAGNVGTLQIVETERQYAQALTGYVSAKAQRYQNTAQLFVAMGGGWRDWRGAADVAAAPAKPTQPQ